MVGWTNQSHIREEPVMEKNSTVWVGMDVHKETIYVVGVDHESGAVRSRWEVPNTDKGLSTLIRRMKEWGTVRSVYEAGPCGYELRRKLTQKGIPCEVAAPALIPRKPGDRVKTDPRDAEKLARTYRMGELTLIHVPTPAQEALRDLVRSREDAQEDLVRRNNRLLKFFLRQGRKFEGKNWTIKHWGWIRAQRFEDRNTAAVLAEYVTAIDQEQERLRRLESMIEEASHEPELAPRVARLRTLRGIDTLTAMTLLSELVDMNRFQTPREVMGYVGLVPREHSSGGKKRRGGITKVGNAHVRRVLVESAWHYRWPPSGTGAGIRKRREGQPPEVVEIARKAELRLHRKFNRMLAKEKPPGRAVVAVARELAGFVWAVARD